MSADPEMEVAETVAEPEANPLRVVVMVATESVPGATPVTTTSPVPLMDTDPPAVAVPDQVKLES